MSELVRGERSPSRSRAAWAVLVLALVFETGCAASLAYRQGQGEAKKGNWDLAVGGGRRGRPLKTPHKS
jgi:hypothetical protein